MLTLLILLYIRKRISGKQLRNTRLVSFFLLMFLSLSITIQAQRIQRTYLAVHNGKEVGEMVFTEETNGNSTSYNLISDIASTMLFKIKVHSKEMAHFQNDSLIHSSIYRKINGSTKLHQAVKRENGNYILHKTSSTQKMPLSEIRFNVLKLFAREPFRIREIFSDSYSKMISISQVAADCYEIRLPNGTTCRYYYKDGICTRMVTEGSLYTISFNLK